MIGERVRKQTNSEPISTSICDPKEKECTALIEK